MKKKTNPFFRRSTVQLDPLSVAILQQMHSNSYNQKTDSDMINYCVHHVGENMEYFCKLKIIEKEAEKQHWQERLEWVEKRKK